MTDQRDDTSAVTWAGLLAGCVEFAKATVALPEHETGDRWRASVTPTITLHAIAHALAELSRVTPDDRARAIDMARHQIADAVRQLHNTWGDETIPDTIHDLIEDTRHGLALAESVGHGWAVTADELRSRHPADAATMLLSAGFEGDLFLPAPGIPLFEGTPAAFIRSAVPGMPVDDEHLAIVGWFLGEGEGVVGRIEGVMPALQVYRQFDFAAGRPVRDLAAPIEGELQAGQPLLVPVILAGEMQPVALPPRRPVDLDPIPLEFIDDQQP